MEPCTSLSWVWTLTTRLWRTGLEASPTPFLKVASGHRWLHVSHLSHAIQSPGQKLSDPPRYLLSSGTEDYYMGTYYFDLGKYSNPLAGCMHLSTDPQTASFSGYRLHTEDALLWDDGFQMSWRNWDGDGCDLSFDAPNWPARAVSYALTYEW
mmetsp:Transcript_15684/g.34087  ORF Transcript_15684/g.34087 Transcript_15684/m.34087 type:complete len:153 (+) Transcript_15684:621-1079(+)